MPFQPEVGQPLAIDDVTYRIVDHPAAPGIPYGQEGRQAVVYQLVTQDGGAQALKVFKPRYRSPALVSLADRIAPFARLRGLRVCRRTVLAPQRHAALLRQHPDLTYAVLMPWVEGPTWMEVVLGRRVLAPAENLALARSLAEILVGMEQNGLAHCDVSGPNVLLPALAQPEISDSRPLVELVDVEQLYGSDLRRPELLPGGSPGYAHRTAPDGLWGPTADRFSGAVLLGEILGWCDERVREAAWGENYFDPQEMQREGERFQTLIAVLQERWGDRVAWLFEQAWRSEVLADCATFGQWLVTLPQEVPVATPPPAPTADEIEEPASTEAQEVAIRALMAVARRLEERGNLAGALENYRQAQALAGQGSGLAEELALIVQDVETKRKEADVPELRPPTEAEVDVPAIELQKEKTEAAKVDSFPAYEEGEWARAKELLNEIVRQRPDYERSGQRASTMLAKVDRRLIPLHRRIPVWAWVLGGLAVLALLVVRIAPEESYVSTPPPTSTAIPTKTPMPTRTPRPTETPKPQPTLPSSVSIALSSVDVLYHDDFGRLSATYWKNYSPSNISVTDGLMEIIGQHNWNTNIDCTWPVRENEGVLILFEYDPGAEFELYLDASDFGEPSYRRWGVYAGTYFATNIFRGGSRVYVEDSSVRGNLALRPNTWYYLLLAVNEDAQFVTEVWEKDNPSSQAKCQRQLYDDWGGRTWQFGIGADKGKAYVDAFTVISFDDIK